MLHVGEPTRRLLNLLVHYSQLFHNYVAFVRYANMSHQACCSEKIGTNLVDSDMQRGRTELG
jgi:hypothetical protein